MRIGGLPGTLALVTAGAIACSPAPSASISPLRIGPLPAGTYTTTRFEPTLVVTLGEGWTQLFADDADEVALDHPADRVALNFTRVTRVVDPDSGRPVDAPDGSRPTRHSRPASPSRRWWRQSIRGC